MTSLYFMRPCRPLTSTNIFPGFTPISLTSISLLLFRLILCHSTIYCLSSLKLGPRAPSPLSLYSFLRQTHPRPCLLFLFSCQGFHMCSLRGEGYTGNSEEGGVCLPNQISSFIADEQRGNRCLGQIALTSGAGV